MIKKAFIFPGQGSQFVGMLAEFNAAFPLVKSVFEEASYAVDFDIFSLCQEGPETQLNQTAYTQVAMLTADVAVYRVIQSVRPTKPVVMAGHSLGEYPALVAAESLSLTDAAALVYKRGQLMQAHVAEGQGAMAAVIGLADEQVIELCGDASRAEEQVSAANFNAPGQIVIAGHTSAVQRALALAEKSDARMTKILPVSVPCHCLLLSEAAEDFDSYLQQTSFHKPLCDVISNVDLSVYHTAEEIRTKLKAQLYSPVRWVETIQKIKGYDVDLLIESGPGRVLTGLNKRIDRQLKSISISEPSSLQALEAAVVD